MALCLFCGLAGAFAASRELHATRLIVAAAVVCCLAGACFAGITGRKLPFLIGVVPLAAVVLSAAFDGAWSPLVAAALAALPFGLSAIWFPRPAAHGDTLLCAVAGATLGLFPAVLVLFVAAFVTIAVARMRGSHVETVAFSPFIAGITLAAVTTNLALAA